ncbi:MAG: hypothetical protein C6W57_10690 [Caldibacillus debilis]|nr:MAG: hypothetical protein C6W57_10690 [Caldibacillus debilis]REJ28827.1 MAG: hypothetical protein C6W56_07340 [Caldibacillus debilis]
MVRLTYFLRKECRWLAGRRSTRTGEKVRRSGFKDGKRGSEKRGGGSAASFYGWWRGWSERRLPGRAGFPYLWKRM